MHIVEESVSNVWSILEDIHHKIIRHGYVSDLKRNLSCETEDSIIIRRV